ncbi:MAG TPA: hypothetical protein VK447_06300 [Myxococcaceae bacterium]|nr:hypothetical protein [Myxococcaceae bacterium]
MGSLLAVRLVVSLSLAESPFGTCDEQDFLRYQQEVVWACKVPRRVCDRYISCETAGAIERELHGCWIAKNRLLKECFAWGTPQQQQEIKDMRAEGIRCLSLSPRDRTCYFDPRGLIEEEPVPEDRQVSQQAATMLPAKVEPPGDCTREMFRRLNSKVGEACKQFPMSCKEENLSCDELQARAKRFEVCINARRVLMDVCFRGGDTEHHKVLERLARGQHYCSTLYVVRCRPCPHCPAR